jgi:hypothetical protein
MTTRAQRRSTIDNYLCNCTPFLERRIYAIRVNVADCILSSKKLRHLGRKRLRHLTTLSGLLHKSASFVLRTWALDFSLIVDSVIPYTVFRRQNFASSLWNRIAIPLTSLSLINEKLTCINTALEVCCKKPLCLLLKHDFKLTYLLCFLSN